MDNHNALQSRGETMLTRRFLMLVLTLITVPRLLSADGSQIVHDAEYYILEAQNGEKWQAEDEQLQLRLAELKKKHGTPPNIVHIMWDDTAYGDVGIPAIQKVRGFETPNLNEMARQGILFTRFYTEVGCTPSRAACMTGRHPVRNAMYNIGMLREMHGLRGNEVTIAEVLSEVGYATAFHGKWHLGDIEESYAHNQGFDEAFFTGYNQILSLWTRMGEGANATMGLYEDMLPQDPYKLDDSFITKGWALAVEGTKDGPTRQWGDNSHETYLKMDAEAQRRTLAFIERNAKAKKPFYVANWPNMSSFLPSPEKKTVGRSLLQDGLQGNVDPFCGQRDCQVEGTGHRGKHLVDLQRRQRADGAQSSARMRIHRDDLPRRQGRFSRRGRPRPGAGLVAGHHRSGADRRRHYP